MTQRDRIVMIVVACAVALGGFYMFALKPKRQEAADTGQQLEQATQRLDAARAQVANGQAAHAKYAANYSNVARLGKAVPTDDDVPSLVYQLDSTAKDSDVDFRSVKLTSGGGASQTPANSAQAAAATQDKAQNNAASQDGKDAGANAAAANSGATPPAGAAPAAPTQTATAGLPPGATVGQAGLNTMPFSFTFEGSFFKLSDFMTRLERYIKATHDDVDVRGRLLMIDGISLSASPKGFPNMKAAISAQAYLLPADQGLYNGASPTGPTAMTAEPATGSGGGAPVAPAAVTP